LNTIIQAIHFGTSTDDGTYPAAIVAVALIPDATYPAEVMPAKEWAAYAGGYPMYAGPKHGAEMVARNGDKLSKGAATALFPNLPADEYRE
jgi:hypothetical protein